MTLPDAVLVRRKDVMTYLGITRDQFRGMVQSGTLTPKFLRKNRKGKPAGRPMYSRRQVEELAGI